jgi:hypothetical protein
MKKITGLLLATILFVSCSKDNVETPANISSPAAGNTGVVDNSTIVTYKDVEFSQTEGSTTYATYFSTKTGKSYKDSELNETNGPDIDLAFVGNTNAFIFFTSPNDTYFLKAVVPGATKTLVINNKSGFSAADFDAMVDDTKLKDLKVINDDDSIGSLQFPLVVIFQNAKGKKGVIKLKEINKERLLVDIKVQK